MHSSPATPDEAIEYLKEFREQARLKHIQRMEEWNKFETEEYQNYLTEELLKGTHEDMVAPWLVQTVEEPDVD